MLPLLFDVFPDSSGITESESSGGNDVARSLNVSRKARAASKHGAVAR